MYLDEIKRGLRAEIKKRENEQYFTFQTNIRQMCKDVLSKLEEQESEIADKNKEIAELQKQVHDYAQGLYVIQSRAEKEARRHKYKRCLSMAKVCKLKRIDAADYRIPRRKWDFYDKWLKRWLSLADKFKEAK